VVKEHEIRRLYSNEIGAVRHDLYRGATSKVKAAIEAGFYIEAISLCESLMADRLEARVSHREGHTETSRRHSTLGSLVRRLKSTEPHNGYEELHSLLGDILKWTDFRNKAVHNAVKISEGQKIQSWDERYGALKSSADQGYSLFKRLTSQMDKIKRKENKK
jgi:hypothetical protein